MWVSGVSPPGIFLKLYIAVGVLEYFEICKIDFCQQFRCKKILKIYLFSMLYY